MRSSNRTINSTKNLITALIYQGIALIGKFISRTIFIKTLGSTYLGINGLFSDILTMLSLAELGIDTVMMHRLYKPLSESDSDKLRLWLKFYKYAYLVVGSVIIVLGLILIPVLPYLVKDYSTITDLGINPVLIFLLFLINSASSYFFMAYRASVIRADQKNYITTTVSIGSLILGNTAQILILCLTKNFVLYVAAGILIHLIANLVCAYIAKKLYPDVFVRTKNSITKEDKKEFFKDLGAVSVAKVNNVVLKGTDNIVLSAFIGIVIVGLYSNYLMLYTTIRSILTSFYSAIKASMGNLFAKAELDKKYAFFKLMNYITIILYGTVAVGVGIVANVFIETWLGTEYLIAFPFSVLIGFEILFMGIKQNLNQVRNISGLFKQMWIRPFVGTIINLVVSIILVQFIGIFGVIIGTITSDILSNFLLDPKIIYKYGFEGKWSVSEYYFRNIRYIMELILVGTMDYFICKYFLAGLGWISVFAHTIICAVSVPAYMLIVYRKTDEAKYVLNKAKSLLVKICGRKSV